MSLTRAPSTRSRPGKSNGPFAWIGTRILSNSMINGLFGFAIGIFPVAMCFGDDPGSPNENAVSPESESQRSGSEILSQGSYSQRQNATLELWRSRELTRDQVQEATRDSDPEVAQRARWILRQWRRGAVPGNPPDISRLLRQTEGQHAIEELLESGQFNAALVAIEEVAGTLQREEVHSRTSLALERRFPIYVKLAMDLQSLPELVQLIDLVADSKEMAICRLQLMQLLGRKIDDDTLLPSAADNWSMADQQHARVLALVVLGRMDDALESARRSGSDDLIRVCLMLRGDWNDLVAHSVNKARAAADGSLEQTRYWCQAMIAADRAG